MDAVLEQKMGQRIFVQRILFGGILWAVVLFGIVSFMVHPGVEPQEGPTLLLALALAGVSTIAVSFVLPSIIERNALAQLSPAIEERAASSSDGPSAFARSASVRVFADPEQALGAAIAAGFTPLVLRLALREATAIFGLVAVFTGHSFAQAIPFFVVSFLAMLPAFPLVSRYTRMLEAAHGARLP